MDEVARLCEDGSIKSRDAVSTGPLHLPPSALTHICFGMQKIRLATLFCIGCKNMASCTRVIGALSSRGATCASVASLLGGISEVGPFAEQVGFFDAMTPKLQVCSEEVRWRAETAAVAGARAMVLCFIVVLAGDGYSRTLNET